MRTTQLHNKKQPARIHRTPHSVTKSEKSNKKATKIHHFPNSNVSSVILEQHRAATDAYLKDTLATCFFHFFKQLFFLLSTFQTDSNNLNILDWLLKRHQPFC